MMMQSLLQSLESMSNVLKQGKFCEKTGKFFSGKLVDRNGVECWFFDGKLHREDGPAVERVDGYKAWYLHDKLITAVGGVS